MSGSSDPRLRISGDWLESSATRAVFAALAAGGHRARAVGGTVRNALLGLPVSDIDIATDATPERVILLAAAAGLRSIPTGLQHGTVTVIADHMPIEVTTLRRDVETDGRHAIVAFTDDWAADAARRDFTINAIYCDSDGTLFDPLGGMADISPVRVRFIGDPIARIREDYLRILRFFRFSASLTADGQVDLPGLAAALAERDGLAQISGERISAELAKLVVAQHAVPVVSEMAAAGILQAATGLTSNVDRFSRLVAIESVMGLEPDVALRTAALLVNAEGDAQRFARRLKPSAAFTAKLTAAERLTATGIRRDLEQPAARALCYRMRTDAFRDAVLLTWAGSSDAIDGRNQEAAGWSWLVSLSLRWTPPALPIRGADLIDSGMASGPEVGRVLAELEDLFIASDFSLSRQRLLELAANIDLRR